MPNSDASKWGFLWTLHLYPSQSGSPVFRYALSQEKSRNCTIAIAIIPSTHKHLFSFFSPSSTVLENKKNVRPVCCGQREPTTTKKEQWERNTKFLASVSSSRDKIHNLSHTHTQIADRYDTWPGFHFSYLWGFSQVTKFHRLLCKEGEFPESPKYPRVVLFSTRIRRATRRRLNFKC
ncbi:hypothetical protein B0F90DRAFT_275059 [Multifurca ochricompacta]|uniref:Uncharacterized protein n=1 Tax=Multifurca ochricompacta TaxID=376703 RepID=A0AAD4LWK4_9AGAM|nr:hypothetical protein B0F90DRAFT_275059 [Multifurca ochricompacta]